jgi:hypothetical protein
MSFRHATPNKEAEPGGTCFSPQAIQPNRHSAILPIVILSEDFASHREAKPQSKDPVFADTLFRPSKEFSRRG